MNRESQVKVLLVATFAGAGLLYALTAADGYPWSASTHWALAWSGVLGELPRLEFASRGAESVVLNTLAVPDPQERIKGMIRLSRGDVSCDD